MKKRLALMIMFILIMAFSFTTLAADRSFVAKYVFGGSSQELDTGFRSSDDEVSFDITDVTNYQTGWAMRGVNHDGGATCTRLEPLTGVGTFIAPYRNLPTIVTVRTSITSSDPTAYLRFNGLLEF